MPKKDNNLHKDILVEIMDDYDVLFNSEVLAHFWGEDWPGKNYPEWEQLTTEQQKDLLKLQRLVDNLKQPVYRRAEALNDALRRAAEFMYNYEVLPPDTTTVDGISSYFLNEARFAEVEKKGKPNA